MTIDYNANKANAVVDTLRRLSKGCTVNLEEQKKELANDVHRLAHMGVKCAQTCTHGSYTYGFHRRRDCHIWEKPLDVTGIIILFEDYDQHLI